jgi:hypothetical protein
MLGAFFYWRKQMKEPSSPKWSTFVAKFADGVVTQMTTFCHDGEFDLERSIAASRTAYEAKTGNNKPPLIVSAKLIEQGYDDDTILKQYDTYEL